MDLCGECDRLQYSLAYLPTTPHQARLVMPLVTAAYSYIHAAYRSADVAQDFLSALHDVLRRHLGDRPQARQAVSPEELLKAYGITARRPPRDRDLLLDMVVTACSYVC